ncbi:MAG: DUF3786 domain-containing protein [Candidatus Scalindua sp. AMX11]|nr:MAG: DUF3786 domain-containing protein [Candidatus Scalindua sp.]NOG82760.1 DUF3786 domain-containing protein [Planctomycetota bacterium]RZV95357.1 MAG: DUF3786 domain-containing protein [Candidatus Scalindua sp. SCAELEC01]TDE66189.1 MAG: DUF3786 domain-containing protein [Candidatus Scalindua sp. AMX11]GJQ57807.1 MAG: hypothetical protein SCALA701_06080 [Candidatus Scalindua sp.]
MIEILKKLPKTNCGECGELTCMAFALQVSNAKRNLTDCPFVEGENSEETSTKSVKTLEDNYGRVSAELEEKARQINFKESARSIGGHYENRDGRETIKLQLMDKIYEMRPEGLFQNSEYCKDSWTKIIVYDYLTRMGKQPLSGDWVTLGCFRNTASHVKAFHKKSEEKIAEAFNHNIDGLKLRCSQFEGREDQGKITADYVCRFNLLPRIPLYLCFWEADEEYQASCKLFLDSNAEDYIDIEYLAYLVESFVDLFIG